MSVIVTFSGKVQEYSHAKETSVDIDNLTDVSGILRVLVTRFPEIERITKHLFISVNGKLATRDQTVCDHDEVTLFFRMGGG